MTKIGEFSSWLCERKLIQIAAPSLVIITFAFSYWLVAFQHDVGIGIDAYYYVLQIDTYLSSGLFYFPTGKGESFLHEPDLQKDADFLEQLLVATVYRTTPLKSLTSSFLFTFYSRAKWSF